MSVGEIPIVFFFLFLHHPVEDAPPLTLSRCEDSASSLSVHVEGWKKKLSWMDPVGGASRHLSQPRPRPFLSLKAHERAYRQAAATVTVS